MDWHVGIFSFDYAFLMETVGLFYKHFWVREIGMGIHIVVAILCRFYWEISVLDIWIQGFD
jgi:hypothetical protein